MTTRVSILINNYNYGRFLADAVDSALGQLAPAADVEVIVVDDGSTDDSRDVLARYGPRVTAICQPNRGQAAAFNAGVAAATGDVLCFLDADDVFAPNKVARVLAHLARLPDGGRDVMLCHSVQRVDAALVPTTAQPAPLALGADDAALRRRIWEPASAASYARRYRHLPFAGAPTSGIVLGRGLADRLFPLPTEGVRTCADVLIVKGAMLLADVWEVSERLALYRVHGSNNFVNAKRPPPRPFFEVLDRYLNDKLRAAGRANVPISYFDSLFARDFYLWYGPMSSLLRLAMTVAVWHLDWRTARFFLTTFGLGLLGAVGLRHPRQGRGVAA